jgi:O-antigen ligase
MKLRAAQRPPRPAAPWTVGRSVALAVFLLMAVGAPLCFGAVDRLPQLVLLVLLAIGMIAQPPVVVPLSRWGNRLALSFVALLLFKEFAPASWFGETPWRTTLTRDFLLELPFTHHPEPARALEVMLSGVVGVVWFLWMRRLAAERDNRPILAWTLFAAAAIVAVVSFATRHPGSEAIYGLRFTPGWTGFGPFPNRNHSADFFAMAAVLGCGCLTWTALHKKWILFAAGVPLIGLIVVALLVTESRGGLVAFAAGLGFFLLLCVWKVRSRRAVAAAVGAALFFGALALIFGAQVFARFQAPAGGEISTLTRLQIWRDTLTMWKDAPLLGHGLNSFASVYPMYQTIELENQMYIHPESSWLQWLVELGAVPLLLAAVAAVLFFGAHLRASFSGRRNFFLRAGGFAAGAVVLCHALFDVPAHRWGTAGFALAALAIACPMRIAGRRVREPRQAALVPLAIAAFWALPFLWKVPAWSPTSLLRLMTRDSEPGLVPIEELQAGLRYFPLQPDLHQKVGLRELRRLGLTAPEQWRRHFAIAARLQPSSWYLSVAQARAVQRISPPLALPYWQEAVQRGNFHREVVLGMAVQETAHLPASQAAWGRYAEAHPQLLLALAQYVPDVMARYYYDRWWKQRAQATDLGPNEIRDFYAYNARWGRPGQFEEWRTRHPEWEARDARQWATLFHAWKDDARAWELLARTTPEPAWPVAGPNIAREQLEARWRLSPQNYVNAQQLATVLYLAGEVVPAEDIVVAAAAGAKAPKWFIDKAAHIHARRGNPGAAAALLLRSS